jgi:hypothetical protein
MVDVKENKNVDEEYLKGQLDSAAEAWFDVQKVKGRRLPLNRLRRLEQKLEASIQNLQAELQLTKTLKT